MSCLNINAGLFYNSSPGAPDWMQTGTVTTPNGVTITASPSAAYPGILVEKGGTSEFFTKPANGTVYYATWGSPANYIAILTVDDSTPGIPSSRTVVLVNTSGSGIDTVNLDAILADSTYSLPSIQPSQINGCVFMLLMSGSAGTSAAIYRSDNGAFFCGRAAFSPDMQVLGNSTADELQVLEGSDVIASCLRPRGNCAVVTDPVNFPDAVLGASDPALAIPTQQARIRNDGDDCLTITAIGNVTPYSVVGTTPALGATLDVGDEMIVDIRFAPTSTGHYNEDLPIVRSPAEGDDAIRCRGEARNARHTLSYPGSRSFGTVPVGTSVDRTLTIVNNGETNVVLSVPGSSAGDFQWSGFSGTLNPGLSTDIAIHFRPGSEGLQNASLTFTSDADGSPHSVSLSGSGCVAKAGLVIDAPTGIVDFGSVQRGFRSVRIARIRNAGSGPLNFRARVSGTNLFGLTMAGESVTSPSISLSLTIDPMAACGSYPTGSGELAFGITFFANDTASATPVTGQLIIDNHNDPTGIPASFSFDLRATIVESIGVDAALVLDRSGSMAGASGERYKIDVAVDAGQLFVQLGRPDVGDRVGLTKFNETPSTFNPIEEVTTANQSTLASKINLAELNPDGTTAIAGGVLQALRDLNQHPRPAPVPEDLRQILVVLTDAIDNTPYTNPDDGITYTLMGDAGTTALPVSEHVKIYGVGIGDSIDAARLGQLAQATGGDYLNIRDFSGLDYFKLEKHFTQIYMDTVDLATIIDPTYVIQPFETHTIPFEVLRGDVGCMVVIYDRYHIRLPFFLETPQGEIVELTTLPAGFQLRPGMTGSARFLEVRFPANDPERYAGTWKAVIKHDGRACYDRGEGGIWHLARTMVPNNGFNFGFQPTSCKETGDPLTYGIAVGVGSNFRMQAYVDPAIIRVGEPIRLNALLSEFGFPVAGSSVMVTARSPNGDTEILILRDDGLHDDGEANDGDYGGRFSHTFTEGNYEFTFRATGYSRDGEPVTREATRAKFVEGRTPVVQTDDETGGKVVDIMRRCCQRLYIVLGLIWFTLLFMFLLLYLNV